jgi:hypothetical protein
MVQTKRRKGLSKNRKKLHLDILISKDLDISDVDPILHGRRPTGQGFLSALN